MSKKFLVIFAVVGLTVFTAHGKSLSDEVSPSVYLEQASVKEKKAFVSDWMKWVETQSLSKKEKTALLALVSPSKKLSGVEVLENVDASILAWFYGFEESPSKLLHKTGRISRSTDTSVCLQYQLCVIVTKSRQRMTAYLYGQPIGGLTNIPVSTARRGKVTPTGLYSINQLAGPHARSGKYNGAYMGWRMQFMGDYFLHATSKGYYSKLGKRASAGCVRMTYGQAKQLNQLMRKIGRPSIRVVIR